MFARWYTDVMMLTAEGAQGFIASRTSPIAAPENHDRITIPMQKVGSRMSRSTPSAKAAL